ncbi:hypothetical protein [Bathymodiolus japonicus methanotrophic gill symbiont]|uniref:hypothetical protein n=1 Tax=Bathymodiolus japonicus methanotrophic gill symbiont TaxID=113269 RepID=UPI001C8DB2FC|nr:hypothetical protein [Bathymodiolus japonicus methanotrophic gill symbiont]
MCSVCGGRRAAGASPIRCVGERITATGVPEFREVAWRACDRVTLMKFLENFFRQLQALFEIICCSFTVPTECLFAVISD